MPPPFETITSRGNPLLRQLRHTAARGGVTARGSALAESPHLLKEALHSGIEIERVFASERAYAGVAATIPPHRRIPLHRVADKLFAEASSTSSPQGVLALVRLPASDPETVFSGLALVLDGVQDPGNAGAIARSAEAFGASGVVFLKGSAAPTNPKTLRASAGSLFRLPFLAGVDADQFLEVADGRGKRMFAATAHGGKSLLDADLGEDGTVIIGSETHGIAAKLLDKATPLAIPTESVESLNAAAAAAVILYEHARRKLRP